MSFNLCIGTYINMEDSKATTQLSSDPEETSISVRTFKARARKRSSWTEQHKKKKFIYKFSAHQHP